MDSIRITSFLMVATFFGLWLSVYLPLELELLLSFLLIGTFGILHGANDIGVLTTYFQKRGAKIAKTGMTLLYIVMIASICIVFYFFPTIALVLFILFSSYHFGEQHWNASLTGNLKGKPLFYILYGGLILFMLFYAHRVQVVQIVSDITGQDVPTWVIGQLFLGVGIVTSLYFLYFAFAGLNSYTILLELFLLGVFYVVFNTASLLLAFCIYFVIWHSIPSLLDQMKFLYGDVSWKSFYRYFKSSFVYWLASLVGTFVLYLLLRNAEEFMVPGLICFLASITVPHVLVMTKIEEFLKTHPETDVGGNAQ
ncbi:Brp/Blh family beta-carotene 15,15'-dioxygenase [Flagellimonas marinaquae]|uniref:Brp/Blh family beta-carotene 15,15'-dioxygenase n=1 Tax=Flagellimonas marinaquae TaxID=254955 RepID=UPI000F8E19B2|nr:Brp/Blh family beta-carotene 15,15'-dioxygenase [Allomuricauda aquimarina]